MANRKQLDPLEVDVLVRIVEELRSELEHTVPNASWRMMADEINSALVRGAIAPETLRVLVKDRRAGASVAKILRDFAHKRRWDRRLGIREPVLAGAEPAPQVAAEAAASRALASGSPRRR